MAQGFCLRLRLEPPLGDPQSEVGGRSRPCVGFGDSASGLRKLTSQIVGAFICAAEKALHVVDEVADSSVRNALISHVHAPDGKGTQPNVDRTAEQAAMNCRRDAGRSIPKRELFSSRSEESHLTLLWSVDVPGDHLSRLGVLRRVSAYDRASYDEFILDADATIDALRCRIAAARLRVAELETRRAADLHAEASLGRRVLDAHHTIEAERIDTATVTAAIDAAAELDASKILSAAREKVDALRQAVSTTGGAVWTESDVLDFPVQHRDEPDAAAVPAADGDIQDAAPDVVAS